MKCTGGILGKVQVKVEPVSIYLVSEDHTCNAMTYKKANKTDNYLVIRNY